MQVGYDRIDLMKRYVKPVQDSVFGMANLYPKRTGLPVVLWVDNVGVNRNVEHNKPRIKVQNTLGDKVVDDTFTLSLEKNPVVLAGKNKLNSKVFKQVLNYVKDHLDDFLASWYQEIDEDELKDRLYIK